MKIHTLLFASLVAVSGAAFAHDPSLHEPMPTPAPAAKKPKPTTCEQLADTTKYDVNLADAATQALKAQCDAKKPVTGKK